MQETPSSGFYVYRLTDPRTGAPFYIGKGKGRRIEAHEAEARRGACSRKCDRIREIWSAGQQVKREIISAHADENDALQAEFDEIATVGLKALTNVLPGGAIGRVAYFERLAEASRRAEAKRRAVMESGLVGMAPKFADLLKHDAAGNDYGFYLGNQWNDIRLLMLKVFDDMVAAVGFDRSRAIMAPYGVRLVAP